MANYFAARAQAEGVIGALRPWLARAAPVAAQSEALHALYNLCKMSRARQEAAAAAGVVPYLAALAAPPPPADTPPVRARAARHQAHKLWQFLELI